MITYFLHFSLVNETCKVTTTKSTYFEGKCIKTSLNVAGDSSQPAFDVQYEVPPTEGDLITFQYNSSKC